MWSEEIYYNPSEREKMLNDLESMLFGKGKHVAQYSSIFEILKMMKSIFWSIFTNTTVQYALRSKFVIWKIKTN